jgi:hypothetical protein
MPRTAADALVRGLICQQSGTSGGGGGGAGWGARAPTEPTPPAPPKATACAPDERRLRQHQEKE